MRLIGLAVVPCPLGCCRVQNPASGTMRRRELIAIAGTGLVAWPLVARAQQQARIARLGYLGFGSPANAATLVRVEALRAGLRDFGYVEGKNLVIEFRWSDTVEQLHEAAAELVRMKVDVIFSNSSTETEVARPRRRSLRPLGHAHRSRAGPTSGEARPEAPVADHVRKQGQRGRRWPNELRAGLRRPDPTRRYVHR